MSEPIESVGEPHTEIPARILASHTLRTAVIQAGFTQHVAVVAMLELFENNSVDFQLDQTSLMLLQGSEEPKESALAVLKKQLFAEHKQIPFKRFEFELRLFLWRGRAALLSDAELKTFFLRDPSKQKRVFIGLLFVAVFPLIVLSIIAVQTQISLGILSSIGTVSLLFFCLRHISRLPETLTPQGESLRMALVERKTERTFWDLLESGEIPATGTAVPPRIQEILNVLQLDFPQFYKKVDAALLREYRRSPVGQ